MSKINAHLEMSLDGVAEAPETWAHTYFIDEMAEGPGAGPNETGTVLFGRKTYEEFAAYWPYQDAESVPFAGFLNGSRKIVASNTMTTAPWGPSEIISGDVEATVADLKGKPGPDMLVLGSLTLVGALVRARLLDTLEVNVFPVLLGKGRRLFENPDQVPLALVDSHTFKNGVLRLRYEPAP